MKLVIFFSLLLSINIRVNFTSQSQVDKSVSELIEKTKREILTTPNLSKAYYHERLENDSSSISLEAMGFYASALPPLDNAMLYKFFFPYNLKKSNQDKSWVKIYENTCKKNQLKIKNNVPPDYSNLISDYRWFLKGGPYSEYSDHYEFEIDSNYSQKHINFIRIRYNLKRPIGRFKDNSGTILYDKSEKRLLKINSEQNSHFSGLYHKNVQSQLEIKFSYTQDGAHCFFSYIKFSYKYNGIQAFSELYILDYPVNVQFSDNEISFLRYMNQRPFVFYSEAEWSRFENIYNIQTSEKDRKSENEYLQNSNKYYFNYNDKNVSDRYSILQIQQQLKKFNEMYSSSPINH